MTTINAPMPSLSHRASRWFSRNLIRIYAALAFIYLFIPVAYTFVFSFNDAGKSNLVWQGFTLENWQNPCGAPQVCEAVVNSLQIGVISTVLATILGTMIAFALGRYKFKGRKSTNLLIFLPMATPEVVLGASLHPCAAYGSTGPTAIDSTVGFADRANQTVAQSRARAPRPQALSGTKGLPAPLCLRGPRFGPGG